MFRRRDLRKKAPAEELSEEDILTQYNDDFVRFDAELKDFVLNNEAFMQALRERVEARNAALERVMNELKNRLKNSPRKKLFIGDFSASARETEAWNTDKLMDIIPEEYFRKVFEPVVSYKVREEELDSLIEQKKVSESAIRKALTTKTTIVRGQKVPKEIKVP